MLHSIGQRLRAEEGLLEIHNNNPSSRVQLVWDMEAHLIHTIIGFSCRWVEPMPTATIREWATDSYNQRIWSQITAITLKDKKPWLLSHLTHHHSITQTMDILW